MLCCLQTHLFHFVLVCILRAGGFEPWHLDSMGLIIDTIKVSGCASDSREEQGSSRVPERALDTVRSEVAIASASCSSACSLEQGRDCLPHSCCCLTKHDEHREKKEKKKKKTKMNKKQKEGRRCSKPLTCLG